MVGHLVFIKQSGFPRRWLALPRGGQSNVAVVVQEHDRDGRGKSVFRYRAALLRGRQLGLFTTLRQAKQAIREALDG
jgi:hypothetical protein